MMNKDFNSTSTNRATAGCPKRNPPAFGAPLSKGGKGGISFEFSSFMFFLPDGDILPGHRPGPHDSCFCRYLCFLPNRGNPRSEVPPPRAFHLSPVPPPRAFDSFQKAFEFIAYLIFIVIIPDPQVYFISSSRVGVWERAKSPFLLFTRNSRWGCHGCRSTG